MKIIIGIDPDLHKSGYAVYDGFENKIILCTSLTMWDLFYELINMQVDDIGIENPDLLVLLEYPSNTNTYHAGGKGAALNVGKNQAVAIIIKEFLDYNKINYKLLKPSGYSNFFKDKEFFKKQTGWSDQTNNDARSAAAMVWINK